MRVKYVSGMKVRNSLDVNFGVIGSQKFYPFIPKNEIWFDVLYIDEKDHFLKIHLHELKLMKKMSYEKARAIIEKSFVKKIDKIPNFVKRQINYYGFKIKYVDGRIIRKYIDPKFILGCHWVLGRKTKPLMNKKEIWIDVSQEKKEYKYTLLHEYEEAKLMLKGMDYNDAHDFALAYEKVARRKDGAVYPQD